MAIKRKVSPKRTNPRKYGPVEEARQLRTTNKKAKTKRAAGHNPMEKKKPGRMEQKTGSIEYKTAKAKPKTNPKENIKWPTFDAKSTGSKKKPKTNTRKRIRLPPEIIGKNITKKTAKKGTDITKKTSTSKTAEFKRRSAASKKGWVTRKRNAKKVGAKRKTATKSTKGKSIDGGYSKGVSHWDGTTARNIKKKLPTKRTKSKTKRRKTPKTRTTRR